MKDQINIRLRAVYEFINKHYKVLLIFSAPIILIYHIFENLLFAQLKTLEFNGYLITAILTAFIYLGTLMTIIIYLVDRLTHKKSIDINDLKLFIKTNILLITTSVFLIMILTNIGFLLLIVPGIYVFTRLAAVPFFISLDNVKLWHSIDLSFEYSRKFTWPMFFCFVIITFIHFNVLAILSFFQLNVGGFIGTVANALIYIIEIILVYHFYLDIKKDMLAAYNSQFLSPGTVTDD